jgi:hypothetical protein
LRDDPQGRRADPAEAARPLGQWPRRGAGRRCRGRRGAVLGRRHLLRHGRRPRGRHRAQGAAIRARKDLQAGPQALHAEHKNVFKILGAMQDAYYKSDDRRERFVSLCHDVDVQRLTFEAYMNKELVKARPLAHLKIG